MGLEFFRVAQLLWVYMYETKFCKPGRIVYSLTRFIIMVIPVFTANANLTANINQSKRLF
ncbi:hypothetical protein SAMN05216333_1215 [Nitrosomonas oligotropha]|uniref:Uncharacterized protein n=1 Tax=Nitrosomonas oligotropha TaxID=42354 RepID=A0A1H8SYC9_9PROT|nr:hypothetical protein SAMN05216300_1225 [Nitrosomonas oligotropha]SEO83647.1 hypothetical protein SAMN05216333_1215 [Nitrosomonas oligotropha]